MQFKERNFICKVNTYGFADVGVGAGVDALEVLVLAFPFASAFFLACLFFLFVIAVGRISVRVRAVGKKLGVVVSLRTSRWARGRW